MTMKNDQKYYFGEAVLPTLDTEVGVLLRADNQTEAQQRYRECLDRHPELMEKLQTDILLLQNAEEIMSDVLTDEKKDELEKYDSAVI